MPKPPTADGPWGEAVHYWLKVRDMRQADLARLAGIEAKTISTIARGFHTQTRQLAKIAAVLKVPLDDILVSPERKMRGEDRRRLAVEISERVLREIEGSQSPAPLSPSVQTSMDMLEGSVINEEARTAPRRHARKQTSKKKSRK